MPTLLTCNAIVVIIKGKFGEQTSVEAGLAMRSQSKHERIYKHLLALLKKGEIGGLLPTETEVAKELQVNRTSVSKALSALKSQGYISRKQGRGSTILKRCHEVVPGIISVLPGPAASIADDYFLSLMQTISLECIGKGYVNALTGCPAAKAEASFDYDALNSLAASGHHLGAIILDTKLKHPLEWREHFKYPAFPVVWLAMPPGYFEGMSSVDIDNRAAAAALVERLHDLGYRRIGYLSSQLDTMHRVERFEGYKQALAKLNLKLDAGLVLMEDEEESMLRCGHKLARRLAELRNPPEAFLVADYTLCHGIKMFEAECGPCGFSERPAATFDYKFTGELGNVVVSVSQPFRRMAEAAFELLLGVAEGQERPPAHRVLKAELITKP